MHAACRPTTPCGPTTALCVTLTCDVVLWPAAEVQLALVAHQHQADVQAHAGQLLDASLSL